MASVLPVQQLMKRSVLIVDDDESTRFVLSRALEGMGWEVIATDDGADVPALIASHCFDLLLLDLYMPGMNGFEVLRQIRHERVAVPAGRTLPNVPVLVVSGEAYAASLRNAKALGADGYLVKPVDLGTLERTVEELVQQGSTSAPGCQ